MPDLNLGHSLDDLVEIGQSFSATPTSAHLCRLRRLSPGQLEDE